MESSSDLSSVASHQIQPGSIPSIHIEQYLDEHARNLSSIHQSPSSLSLSRARGKEYPRIFTVAQTLKDPLILNHIKPDYGSLGEFIGDINIGRDLLNQKKKKNQFNQDDLEEKKLKSIFKQKTQHQLNNLYVNKSSSSLYKKVAGKLLVENLFKQSFGVTLSTFQNQNVKPQPTKNVKINFDKIEQIFSGRKQYESKSQTNKDKKTSRAQQQPNGQQKQSQPKPSQKSFSYSQKLQTLNSIKQRYPSLKRTILTSQAPQMLSQSSLTLQKQTVKPEALLQTLCQLQLHSVESILMDQIRISEQLLLFFIDVIKIMCPSLVRFAIRCVSLERNQAFANKIREFVENSMVREIAIQCMDLETKEFCVICLGIGANNTLEFANFDNNSIDQRGCKSLQLISKHCLNLKKISLKKNYVQPHHLSYFPVQSKLKIIL